MTASFADASPGYRPPNRTLTLTGLFWAFSYALLSLRGALFHDDWSRLIDQNRLLTVTAGAVAYGLALRQLQAGHKPTLRGAMTWIAGATLAIMVVRLMVDQMMFDAPQSIDVHLLWSLSWSAYFALWVTGAIAFAPDAVVAPGAAAARSEAIVVRLPTPANLDSFELLVSAILAEAEGLDTAKRAELASRVLALGGYEAIDGTARDNERARLALRLAARLSANSP